MAKYQIWNKEDKVYTPGIDPAHGRVDYTPEEWMERYGWAEIPSESVVLAAGAINGGFCMPLSEMVKIAEKQGCDFSACTTPEEQLATIEAFEDQREAEAQAAAQEAAEAEAANAAITAESLATLAANSEFQTLMMLPDEEVTE